MAELTQLRLPGENSTAWYALDRVVDRPLGCSGCNRRIHPGTPHARGEEDGRRLCPVCVVSAEVGETMTANEANRWQRQRKRDHAEKLGERMIRMLLDGLEVGSIRELKTLVDAARAADRLRGMVRQDAEWARDVLHSGTYEAGGSRHGDRALAYLERIIKRTGETT